jgi:hypothetical protein
MAEWFKGLLTRTDPKEAVAVLQRADAEFSSDCTYGKTRIVREKNGGKKNGGKKKMVKKNGGGQLFGEQWW